MYKEWQQFLQQRYAGAHVADLVWCSAILLLTLLLHRPVAKLLTAIFIFLTSRSAKEAQRRRNRKMLFRPLAALLSTTGIFYAYTMVDQALGRVRLFKIQSGKTLRYLKLSVLIEHILLFCAIIFLTWLLSRLVDFFYHRRLEAALTDGRRNKVQLFSLLRDVVKILVAVICFFWMLGAVFEVNVPALITGLGIGGVALALAAKESIENLFASFTILADKPLVGGDVIRLGTLEGTVERVGFRSSRLRHADGSLIVIPNKKIVDGILENLTQRAGKVYTISIFLKKEMPAGQLAHLRESVNRLLHETENVQPPISVKLESPNENAWQLIASYNLPFPAPDGLAADEFKETMKLKMYRLAEEAAVQDPEAGTAEA